MSQLPSGILVATIDGEHLLPTRSLFDTTGRICETWRCCRTGNNAGSVSRAEVAELADARGSGPRTRKGVGVRVPSSAPKVP
jgi:hypothetical protein